MRIALSVAMVLALSSLAPPWAWAARNAVWANSLPCEAGGSVDVPITGSVNDPGATVEWAIANEAPGTPAPGPAGATDSADVTPGTGGGVLSPDSAGFFSSSVSVGCGLGLLPGDVAVYTLSITSDATPVAANSAAVTVTGETAPSTTVPVTPKDPTVAIAQSGQEVVIKFEIENNDPVLPHAFDFVAESENDLAPGLDLYDLTPVSGFDLPTVIGAGTPLMTGKLEPIPPLSILDVEIKVETAEGQTPGEGNKIHFTVEDDDSPAKSNGSGNGIVRGIQAPALGKPGTVALLGFLVLAAVLAVRRKAV